MKTDFKIEDNIDIPGVHRESGVFSALRALEIGQSFFVPKGKTQVIGASWRAIKQRDKSFSSRKFTSRTVTHEGVKGVRVWRVA